MANTRNNSSSTNNSILMGVVLVGLTVVKRYINQFVLQGLVLPEGLDAQYHSRVTKACGAVLYARHLGAEELASELEADLNGLLSTLVDLGPSELLADEAALRSSQQMNTRIMALNAVIDDVLTPLRQPGFCPRHDTIYRAALRHGTVDLAGNPLTPKQETTTPAGGRRSWR